MQPSATSVTEFTIWKMFEFKRTFQKKKKCGEKFSILLEGILYILESKAGRYSQFDRIKGFNVMEWSNLEHGSALHCAFWSMCSATSPEEHSKAVEEKTKFFALSLKIYHWLPRHLECIGCCVVMAENHQPLGEP